MTLYSISFWNTGSGTTSFNPRHIYNYCLVANTHCRSLSSTTWINKLSPKIFMVVIRAILYIFWISRSQGFEVGKRWICNTISTLLLMAKEVWYPYISKCAKFMLTTFIKYQKLIGVSNEVLHIFDIFISLK